jgi:type III pantothenate kinase
MLLTVDIGNSNIVIGAFAHSPAPGEPDNRARKPVATWRLATERARTSDEYRLLLLQLWREHGLDARAFHGAAIVSVVAPLTDIWVPLLTQLLSAPPLVIHAGLDLGLNVKLGRPEVVGTDRLVDAVAAFQRSDGPAIAVDFGTATTFNVVTRQGDFIGGAIAPGLGTVTNALVERASALPAVELVPPPTAIGADTIPAIQSGLVFGYVGLVEGLLARLQAELGDPAHVIATGGLGHVIAPLTDAIHEYDPWLTLAGVRAVYLRNQGSISGIK